MRNYLFSIIFVFYSCFALKGQDIPVHMSHSAIYDFLDELANQKSIEINSSIKPYSRTFVLDKLKEVNGKADELNKRQKSELEFYLKNYHLFDSISQNPYTGTAKLNIFRKSKYASTGISPLGFFYKDELFTLSIRPIWGIRYYISGSNTLSHSWGGGEFYSSVGKHWGFYASVRDNYQTEVLAFPAYFTLHEGGNYKTNEGGREGGDFSEMRGGVNYSWNWGSVGLVKDHLQWGNNYHGSNIFSGKTPSFGMIQFKMHPTKWLDFNYFHGWLVSEVVDYSRTYITSNGDLRTVFRDKYIAANMFTIKPWQGVAFSVGNSIIYSDLNIQPAYLIPFMFFKSIDHTINHNIDNQNSQMFTDLSLRVIKHLHTYGSLYVDELSITRIGVDSLHNFISYKIGSRLSNWPFENISLTAEYTKSYPITYKHRVPATTFESNKFNLGHYLRDNSEEYYFSLQYKPLSRLRINLSYINAKHGNEYAYLSGSDVVEHPILEDITWQNESVLIKLNYEFISETYLVFEIVHTNVQGFDVDGKTAQEYLDMYSPEFFHGKNNIITLGFNIGF